MPNTTVRANARALPKAAKRQTTKSKPSRPRVIAVETLGKRLEKMMREQNAANRVRAEAGVRFEKIVPKGKPMEGLPPTSAPRIWDSLLEPPKLSRPASMEQRWQIIQCLFDSQRKMRFATIKAAAKKSGYATAAERVKSIDAEILDLASRALKVQAASITGVRSQALALLALDQVRYGIGLGQNRFPSDGVLMLSRAIVDLSDTQEARA
jgi:hypothetical protein